MNQPARLGLGLVLFLAATATAVAQHRPFIRKTGFVRVDPIVNIHYIDEWPAEINTPAIGRTPAPDRPCDPLPCTDAARPTILFVPGWTMPSWIWEQQIEHFAPTHRVVAIDPRSQGVSTPTHEGLDPATRARDIKAVIDKLRLRPVVIVAWSMAVNETIAYVDQFGTNDLAGLVLVDDATGTLDPPDAAEFLKFLGQIVSNRRATTDHFIRSFFKKPQSEDFLRRVVDASLSTSTDTAVALLVGKVNSDYSAALKKIDKPTLVFAADGDGLPYIKRTQSQIPGSKLEIFEGDGHALFVDDADRFNSLLDQFLSRMN